MIIIKIIIFKSQRAIDKSDGSESDKYKQIRCVSNRKNQINSSLYIHYLCYILSII